MKYVISYVDNEGDEITISDDDDLRCAGDFALNVRAVALKVFVRHVDEQGLDDLHYSALVDRASAPDKKRNNMQALMHMAEVTSEYEDEPEEKRRSRAASKLSDDSGVVVVILNPGHDA